MENNKLDELNKKKKNLEKLLKDFMIIFSADKSSINPFVLRLKNNIISSLSKYNSAITDEQIENISNSILDSLDKLNFKLNYNVSNFEQNRDKILENKDRDNITRKLHQANNICDALKKIFEEYDKCNKNIREYEKLEKAKKSISSKSKSKSKSSSSDTRDTSSQRKTQGNLKPQTSDKSNRTEQSTNQLHVLRPRTSYQPTKSSQQPIYQVGKREQTIYPPSDKEQTLNQSSESRARIPDELRRVNQSSEQGQPTDLQTESIQTTNQPTKSAQPAYQSGKKEQPTDSLQPPYQEGKHEQSIESPTEKIQKFIEESFGVNEIKQILLFNDDYIEKLQELTQHMSSEDIVDIEKKFEEYSIDSSQDISLQEQIKQLKKIVSENLKKIREAKENKENSKQNKPETIETKSDSLQMMEKSFKGLDGYVWYSIPWKEFEKIEQASEQENNEEPTLD